VPAVRRGGARVALGLTGAVFDRAAEELEGFARPLWGIVPLVAGGGEFDHWDLVRTGLANGTDPEHPQYWGATRDRDQRMVEMASIGLALALVPEHVWEPLSPLARERLVAWLDGINRYEPHGNNWQFFRVLVNLGLRRVGAPVAQEPLEASLHLLESHYVADGWYRDGEIPGNFDLYVAWAYHFYGLVYAVVAAREDPDRCKRFRERARRFALDFEHWFDPGGAVVPFGRSLTYRFAAVSFWAALAFADEEALPWGRIKGLYLRHLRDWARRPIAGPDGVLTIGYSYDNLLAAESYNSPGSPYWAMKAFLALALPESHPFWRVPEEPLPEPEGVSIQPAPGMILSRDETQALMLSGGRGIWFVRQGAAKYGKFAYSSAFGFSLDSDDPAFRQLSDSMLLLRDPDGVVAVRRHVEACEVRGELVWSRWRPMRDVVVETVLSGRAPWHVRLHRLRTERPLRAVEAGFSVGWDGGEPTEPPADSLEEPGAARVLVRGGLSGIRDLGGARPGRVVPMAPNTNLVEPRTLCPVLECDLEPGEHWLACAVLATDRPESADFSAPPDVPEEARRWLEDSALP
jgi:hypothetical protein